MTRLSLKIISLSSVFIHPHYIPDQEPIINPQKQAEPQETIPQWFKGVDILNKWDPKGEGFEEVVTFKLIFKNTIEDYYAVKVKQTEAYISLYVFDKDVTDQWFRKQEIFRSPSGEFKKEDLFFITVSNNTLILSPLVHSSSKTPSRYSSCCCLIQ